MDHLAFVGTVAPVCYLLGMLHHGKQRWASHIMVDRYHLGVQASKMAVESMARSTNGTVVHSDRRWAWRPEGCRLPQEVAHLVQLDILLVTLCFCCSTLWRYGTSSDLERSLRVSGSFEGLVGSARSAHGLGSKLGARLSASIHTAVGHQLDDLLGTAQLALRSNSFETIVHVVGLL